MCWWCLFARRIFASCDWCSSLLPLSCACVCLTVPFFVNTLPSTKARSSDEEQKDGAKIMLYLSDDHSFRAFYLFS